MEDAEGASSSRQPDDPDDVSGRTTDGTDADDGALPPPPPDADSSDKIAVPPGARDDGPIEDGEVVDAGTSEALDPTAGTGTGPLDERAADPAPDGADGDDVIGDRAAASLRSRRRNPMASEPTRSRVIAGGAVGAVALIGLLGALLAGGVDGGDAAGSPSDPRPAATSEPAPTDPGSASPSASATTSTEGAPVAPATDPVTTAPGSEASPTSAPAPTTTLVAGGVTTLLPDPSATTTTVPGGAQLVARVVPDVAAYPEALDDVAQVQRIAELATTARNDVASPGPIGSLCAVVRLQEQAQLEGRWEFDGDEVDSTNLSTVGEPGFGDCLVAEDGTPLEEGTYQFIVADRDGNDSAAGTFVVGAVPLEQVFVNTSTEPVCVLRLGPSSATRYDAYDFADAPLVPGASVIVPIADVDHEVRVDGCDADADAIAEFDFNPAAGVPRALSD